MSTSLRGSATALILALACPAARGEAPHTFDGRHGIGTINLTVAYLVPKDRTPLTDWRERVDYFMRRIAAFHRRESGGRSTLKVRVPPEPLVVEKTAEQIRGDGPDATFFNSTGAARSALNWPGEREGFPILLVLSEINWRELDDFRRTRVVDGRPEFEGNVSPEGRHFPGAESGGARAVYLPDEGIGLGLVSADGWRVPYSGSDCVVYHEGVGHAIGLPHPEPPDDSVMCFAQYKYWINQTWVTRSQKQALGWPVGEDEGREPPDRRGGTDLFTAFAAIPGPAVPRPGETVHLEFRWPEGAKLRDLNIRVQTDIRGPWRALPAASAGPTPKRLAIGAFDRPTPVSYRVDATLEDGQAVELWGYFQVKGE